MSETIATFTQTHVFEEGKYSKKTRKVCKKDIFPGITITSSAEHEPHCITHSFNFRLHRHNPIPNLQVNVTSRLTSGTKILKERQHEYEYCALNRTIYSKSCSDYVERSTRMPGTITLEYRWEVKMEKVVAIDFREQEPEWTDVVLVVGKEKQKFRVNRALLSAHSSYFRSLFLDQRPEVEVEELDADDLQEILQFIYHMSSIHENNVENLLRIAKKYDLNLISALCRDFLKEDNFLPDSKRAQLSLEVVSSRNYVDFSAPDADLTDVVLIVGEEKQKFYVNKVILASFSSYFYTMFYSSFRESAQSEIELKDIDPETFQALLNIIYHAPNINDNNVEHLLEMARMYDVEMATFRCEMFLEIQTRLLRRDKKRLAEEYGLSINV